MTIPIDGAELLGQYDAAYYRINGIVRVDADGQMTFYCQSDAWSQTLAGQLAAREQEIATLRAQLAALQTARPSAPAQASDDPQACDICGKAFKNRRALQTHQQRTGHAPAPEPTQEPARIILTALRPLDDDPTWRCGVCGSDAFARSMTDPTRCMRCVKATNGVMA